MGSLIEESRTSGEYEVPEGTWVQITFTLDTRHFKELWAYAEDRRVSVPSVVREGVMDLLKKVKTMPPK